MDTTESRHLIHAPMHHMPPVHRHPLFMSPKKPRTVVMQRLLEKTATKDRIDELGCLEFRQASPVKETPLDKSLNG